MTPLWWSVGTPVTTRLVRTTTGPVRLTVVGSRSGARECLERAEAAIRDVGQSCSLRNPASALARVNAAPGRWHDVPVSLAAAVETAAWAHRATRGAYDPRNLGVQLGSRLARPPVPWLPDLVPVRGGWRLHVGGGPIDLSVVSAGLAVRWAAAELAPAGAGYLVRTGTGGAVGGMGPEGHRWRVGVGNPLDGAEPALALDLTDVGCATSSVPVQIGAPATLASLMVVDVDPVWATVLSRTLVLDGTAGIRARADHLGVAVAWIDRNGAVETSAAMNPLVLRRSVHA